MPDSCAIPAQVGYSAIVFYGYVGVIGLALWAMLKWWFKSDVGLAQVWCIYGACHKGIQSALIYKSCTPSSSSGISTHQQVLKRCNSEKLAGNKVQSSGGHRARHLMGNLLHAGYALSIFIPISFVCVLPYEALRWAMIGVATVSSGLFLLLNFKGPIFDVAGAK